jgi:hypothetical protein
LSRLGIDCLKYPTVIIITHSARPVKQLSPALLLEGDGEGQPDAPTAALIAGQVALLPDP